MTDDQHARRQKDMRSTVEVINRRRRKKDFKTTVEYTVGKQKDKDDYDHLIPTASIIPRIYGTSLIHKKDNPAPPHSGQHWIGNLQPKPW